MVRGAIQKRQKQLRFGIGLQVGHGVAYMNGELGFGPYGEWESAGIWVDSERMILLKATGKRLIFARIVAQVRPKQDETTTKD